MPRFKLTIEYDGSQFHGWQRQNEFPSVQQAIEEATAACCQHEVELYAAGRTDTGVHALGQVAHVDLEQEWDGYRLRGGINHYLDMAGHQVHIRAIEPANDDFHARFSATSRSYRYRLVFDKNALLKQRAMFVPYDVNVEKMREEAQFLLGTHDLTSLRADGCQAKSPVKTITNIDIQEVDWLHKELHICCESPSFLYRQMRILTGTLLELGSDRLKLKSMEDIIAAKDRAQAGFTAKAHGLYFVGVGY